HFDTNNSRSNISATFSKAQLAGDLNVVVVGMGDTNNSITSVTDTAGTSYVLAAGPTTNTGVLQAIYYAKQIGAAAAGGNTVTATYNTTVTYPTIALAEYSGVTTADKSATNTGSTLAASSGPVTTTVAPELVFAAGLPDNNSAPDFASGGGGFTVRVITSVAGMILEDRIASPVGSYQATGTLTSASPWVMQTVTFK
ncbi:MAG: hypothetical protein ACXVDD_31120, partial [Polyangia bacterium]